MKMKKFEAGSMKEALEKVKAEMGSEAFILNTKQIIKKGPLGIGNRKFLQVTAAIEEEPAKLGQGPAPAPAAEAPAKPGIDVRQEEETAWAKALAEGPPPSDTYNARGNQAPPAPFRDETAAFAPPPSRAGGEFSKGFDAVFAEARREPPKRQRPPSRSDNKPLRKEIDEIKGMVNSLRDNQTDISPLQKDLGELKTLLYNVIRSQTPIMGRSLSPELMNWFQRLKDSGMDEKVAGKLVQLTQNKLAEKDRDDPKKVARFLQSVIRQSIDVAHIKRNPKGPHVVALVGPTGVGKTTTLAKLAANSSLQQKASVALVTLDTYRIAAVDQLKTYAKIMELPVQVALNISELRSAIQFHGDKDLILIDTAGHSQKDKAAMDTLRTFLEDQGDIEVHLVLSATTKASDLNDIVDKFEKLCPKYLLFTKMDETSAYGPLFNQILKTRKPVSYLTTGQNVPEDFEFASADKLAELFVGKPLASTLGGKK